MRTRSLFVPSLLAAALALAAAGCGGDDSPATADAAPGADAGPTPDGGPAFPPGFENDECLCLALGVDYMNGVGVATVLGLPSLKTMVDVASAGISGDPVVRYHEGKFYVVNRVVANLTTIDAATLTIDAQFAVGDNGDNAQDVAIRGREAWIAYLGVPKVRIFDLDHPDATPTEIALPTLAADIDGNPDANSIVIVGDQAFVSLQHLNDQFAPSAPGGLVVIDAAAKTITTTLVLPDQNPINFLRTDGTSVYAALVPDYDPAHGCLARISTGATPAAECVITSGWLGGYVNGMAPADDGGVYVALATSFTEGFTLRVQPNGMRDDLGIFSSKGQQPTDLALCGKYLVSNDGAAGGVRVYDTGTRAELTTAALQVGEPAAFASGIACFARP
jgi:hypothetical protein